MKITKQKLNKIINEEIKAVLEEGIYDRIPKVKFTTTAKKKAAARARGRQKSSDATLRNMLDVEKQKVAEIANALGGYEDLIEIFSNANSDQEFMTKAHLIRQQLLRKIENQDLSSFYFAKVLIDQAYKYADSDNELFLNLFDDQIDDLTRSVLPAEDTPELDLYYKILEDPKILL